MVDSERSESLVLHSENVEEHVCVYNSQLWILEFSLRHKARITRVALKGSASYRQDWPDSNKKKLSAGLGQHDFGDAEGRLAN